MATNPMPKAKTAHLIVQEVDDETLVYDMGRHAATCVNEFSAKVWRRCDIIMRKLIFLSAIGSILGQTPALAQQTEPHTWYNVLGEPFIVYQDKDRHWKGWDGPHAVDVIVHGSWWNRWGEGTWGGIGIECYPDYLLRMNCD